MSTNFENLDPDSPEYDAAVEAAQIAEEETLQAAADANKGEGDGDEEDLDGEGDGKQPSEATDTAAADAAAAAEATAKAATDAAAATAAADAAQNTPKVAGVLGKDGKTVLPYAALHASRSAAHRHKQRADEAEQQLAERTQELEDLKAGKKPAPTASDLEGLTAQELEDLAADFPAMAKVVKVAQAALTRVAELEKRGTPAEKTTEVVEAVEEDSPEEAIDANPALLGWMTTEEGADKWARAQVLDRALEGSPKWKDKPLVERFAHVTQLVADEFDIALEPGATYQGAAAPAPQKTTATTPSQADPKAAIQKAARTEPNTLSDFKGGAVEQTEQRIESMPPKRMLTRMLSMSDEDIDAQLERLG